MTRIFVLLLILVVLKPVPSAARSIYKLDPAIDGSIIAGTNVLVLSAFAFRNQIINRRCPCDPNEINSFDRFAVDNSSETARALGGATVAVSMIAPITVDYFDVGLSKVFKEDMVVYAETLSVNWFLVSTVKFATRRPLPRLYKAQVQGDGMDYLSFYSGHTSTVVSAMSAMSMTYTVRHGFSWWPWLATGALGVSVGYEMVASAGHFPSDVIVGFVVGGAVGIFVPKFHLLEKPDREGEIKTSLAVLPVDDGAMALLTRRF